MLAAVHFVRSSSIDVSVRCMRQDVGRILTRQLNLYTGPYETAFTILTRGKGFTCTCSSIILSDSTMECAPTYHLNTSETEFDSRLANHL
jgi:hypothetical protein